MKQKKRAIPQLAIGLMLLIGSGCATRQGDLTILSTRNVALNRVDLDRLPQVRGVTGEDSKFIFLFLQFGIPHLEDAVDDALDKGGGDLMIDVVVHRRGWWFLIGEESLTVKGTVINTRGTSQ